MPQIEYARRTSNLVYAIRDLVALARQYENVLYLNIGDPNKFDFSTPPHMIEAVYNAMKENYNGYAPAEGIPEARNAIAADSNRKGIDVTPDDIVVTTGASEAIELALTALINNGENFLTPNPGYPLYTALVSKLEAKMNPYELDPENGWLPDIEDIKQKIGPATKAIVLINPNNPTGSNANKETLKAIIDIAHDRNLVIFSDEIYDKLIYSGENHISTASLTDDVPVITMNGLSKSYLTPGWRIGWMSFSDPKNHMKEYRASIMKLVRARLCANSPMQYAVAPALNGPHDHLKDTIERLEQRAKFTTKRMNEIEGINCIEPKGAFYAFPTIDMSSFNFKTDEEFVKALLREEKVLTVHGSGFGRDDAFRIVYLPPMDVLEKAYDGIERFAARHRT